MPRSTGRPMRSALLCGLLQAVCLAQPRLVLDTQPYDFGKVAPDALLKHPFTIRNEGTEPLVIERVNPSCGCTTGLLGKGTLDPGETTQLEVTFNTAGLRGRPRKTVQILSNDPANPTQTLTFEAEVAGAVDPEAGQVAFLHLARKDRKRTSVKFTSLTGRRIEVVDVDLSQAPWLGVATREEGSVLWVDLDLLARRLPKGRLSGTDTIALHVQNPWPSVVRLSVHWDRLPATPSAP